MMLWYVTQSLRGISFKPILHIPPSFYFKKAFIHSFPGVYWWNKKAIWNWHFFSCMSWMQHFLISLIEEKFTVLFIFRRNLFPAATSAFSKYENNFYAQNIRSVSFLDLYKIINFFVFRSPKLKTSLNISMHSSVWRKKL